MQGDEDGADEDGWGWMRAGRGWSVALVFPYEAVREEERSV